VHDPRRERRLGLGYGLAAYGAWGVFPVYLKAVKTVLVVEVLCHRVVWALAVLAVVTVVRGEVRAVTAALRSYRPDRR
jgi:chloramphenicol-sensitive protein RarD